MKKKLLVVGLTLFVCCFVLVSISQATWYRCKVVRVQPKKSGDVIVWVTPGTGETEFTETSRLRIGSAMDGASKMLATILTAVSMGLEVQFDCGSAPAYNPIEPIDQVQVLFGG